MYMPVYAKIYTGVLYQYICCHIMSTHMLMYANVYPDVHECIC